ncbi:hypothetical protein DFP94_1011370 [Fontibacillus phaseoli]|uniref:Nucleoside 2-deoxyribosyltransferase-like protein n=1 Tax=Fontibacillus phaseoli TaxID=1416533 RepID=A0A369BSW0_9BACL|nr:hypothetical protein [Fontibacillus phaseoli]RCX23768.1 hypothetical protein DFP94_1011370 [Fontibacillus phaseoli]
MIKKRCLFCDEIVPTNQEGDYDKFIGCSCSPGGFYCLLKDSYEPIQSFPHQKKRNLFHLVSAYIRELSDGDEKVVLSADDLESIENSPKIPLSVEDKGNRLLQYLQRHANGPGEPVVIHPLSNNYNLTYSPNLQELVYIIDRLRGDGLLIREGMSFLLTEKGWSQATASAGGKKLKPCSVLIADENGMRTEWQEMLLPKMEQYGYLPRMLTHTKTQKHERYSLELIANSKLVIADLTGQSPEVYLAGGYALGLNIPVLWTVNSRQADLLPEQVKEIRPMVWNTAEELAVILQQKLSL